MVYTSLRRNAVLLKGMTMAYTGHDGKRRHNWVTNSVVADNETHKLARQLIDGCQHLTPAREREIDATLARLTVNVAEAGEICSPSNEYLETVAEQEAEVPLSEIDGPSDADLLAIENDGIA